MAEGRECGRGYERDDIVGLEEDISPGLLAALPIVPSTPLTQKCPLPRMFGWLKLGIFSMALAKRA